MLASVTATETDPQVYSRQVQKLTEAGAIVLSCNAQAAPLLNCSASAEKGGDRMEEKKNQVNRLFASQLWVVNVGVEVFFQAVRAQKVPAVQVDWHPPAGGDTRLAEIMAKLKSL